MTQRAKTIGMIVAAGSGSRAGADGIVMKHFWRIHWWIK
jgi:2-C-methyl-D-erythritol 4-phosphate cytidylyltransferase